MGIMEQQEVALGNPGMLFENVISYATSRGTILMSELSTSSYAITTQASIACSIGAKVFSSF